MGERLSLLGGGIREGRMGTTPLPAQEPGSQHPNSRADPALYEGSACYQQLLFRSTGSVQMPAV